ncbi:MAG: aldose 1-epimerase family protein [Bacteroidota bacterium]|mgnify:CR=1 FL=1|nr:aldose 1-epimerase family protein [Bacteroidota bacterium]
MVYNLRSNNLVVSINSKGAEICSVKYNELEYIWQARADAWPRHTPVLFPIVGRLKNNSFNYDDQSYSLSQHGFARDKEFKCISQSGKEMHFELVSSIETKKVYPFEFSLTIKYILQDDNLICTYEVSNPSSRILLFSIGAHPGFKVPLLENEKFEDYKLKLDSTKKYQTTVLSDGLLSDGKKELFLTNGDLNLSIDLFDTDALVFEDSQIDSISLISPSGKGVELTCVGWPYFGIWSKKGCKEFVCLEPWHGIADGVNNGGDLKTKRGIIELQPEKKFECSFSIRVF